MSTRTRDHQKMAMKAEVKILQEVLLKDPRGFFYVDYLNMVKEAIDKDPSLREPSSVTKQELQKKLNHHIAYR